MTLLLDDKQPEKANVGDIVKIKGYGEEEFEVVSVSSTEYKDMEAEYVATEYETLGLSDKRNYLADENDIEIVRKAEKAEQGAEEDVEVSEDKIEEIDAMLDSINGWLKLIDMFGEDEVYRKHIRDLEDRLRGLTGGK